MLFNLYLILI